MFQMKCIKVFPSGTGCLVNMPIYILLLFTLFSLNLDIGLKQSTIIYKGRSVFFEIIRSECIQFFIRPHFFF